MATHGVPRTKAEAVAAGQRAGSSRAAGMLRAQPFVGRAVALAWRGPARQFAPEFAEFSQPSNPDLLGKAQVPPPARQRLDSA